MERFVVWILAGGFGLLVGSWTAALSGGGTVPWLAGASLAVVGGCVNAYGIASQVTLGGS